MSPHHSLTVPLCCPLVPLCLWDLMHLSVIVLSRPIAAAVYLLCLPREQVVAAQVRECEKLSGQERLVCLYGEETVEQAKLAAFVIILIVFILVACCGAMCLWWCLCKPKPKPKLPTGPALGTAAAVGGSAPAADTGTGMAYNVGPSLVPAQAAPMAVVVAQPVGGGGYATAPASASAPPPGYEAPPAMPAKPAYEEPPAMPAYEAPTEAPVAAATAALLPTGPLVLRGPGGVVVACSDGLILGRGVLGLAADDKKLSKSHSTIRAADGGGWAIWPSGNNTLVMNRCVPLLWSVVCMCLRAFAWMAPWLLPPLAPLAPPLLPLPLPLLLLLLLLTAAALQGVDRLA